MQRSCGWKEHGMFKKLKESELVCLENTDGEGSMSGGEGPEVWNLHVMAKLGDLILRFLSKY